MQESQRHWSSRLPFYFGWLIVGNEAAKGTARRFHSRTGATPPVLRVTYTTGGVITGACCLPDGSCEELTPAQCAAAHSQL